MCVNCCVSRCALRCQGQVERASRSASTADRAPCRETLIEPTSISAAHRASERPDSRGRAAVMVQASQGLHVDVRPPGDTMTVFHPPRDITPVEQVIRWFFSVPQWVQLAGAVLAIAIGIVALFFVWHN